MATIVNLNCKTWDEMNALERRVKEQTSPRWIAAMHGDVNTSSWEVFVVRENNHHGQISWGWFDEDKLLVSHNGGPCRWPLAPGIGEAVIKLAEELADKLNKEEGNK